MLQLKFIRHKVKSRGGKNWKVLYKSNFLVKAVPSSPTPTDSLRPKFVLSSLADAGLSHKLVLKVMDGEALVCRALLDAST